jgi:hypothetical protein
MGDKRNLDCAGRESEEMEAGQSDGSKKREAGKAERSAGLRSQGTCLICENRAQEAVRGKTNSRPDGE